MFTQQGIGRASVAEKLGDAEVWRRASPRLLMAVIGPKWSGNLERTVANVSEGWQERDGLFTFLGVPDLCVLPYQGLGAMRNIAVYYALRGNFDWLLLMDSDVLIDSPGAVPKLAGLNAAAVVPWFDQGLFPAEVRLAFPMYKFGLGPMLLEWSVLSCVLFDCGVFRVVGERPFPDAPIHSADEYTWQLFRLRGVPLWQDTSQKVGLLSQPTKPDETMNRFSPWDGGRVGNAP